MQATNPNGQTCPIASTRRAKTPAPTADTTHHQGKASRPSHDRFLKIKPVLERVGLSSTSLYNLIAKGQFPAQIKIGRTSVWSEFAVNQWMEEQKAGGDA